jgi:hypothetical protein
MDLITYAELFDGVWHHFPIAIAAHTLKREIALVRSVSTEVDQLWDAGTVAGDRMAHDASDMDLAPQIDEVARQLMFNVDDRGTVTMTINGSS